MANKEYSEDFVIYFTNLGIRSISNPASIVMIDEILDHPVTSTEIAKKLNCPISTAQVTLTGLVEDNFIFSKMDENDKRKIVYCPKCIVIMRSVDKKYNLSKTSEIILNSFIQSPSYLYVIHYFCLHEMMAGVDLTNIMTAAGYIIGQFSNKKVDLSSIDAILDYIKKYITEAGLSKLILEMDGQNLKMKLINNYDSDGFILPTYYIASGFATCLLSSFFKKIYHLKSKSYSADEISFELAPYPIDLPEPDDKGPFVQKIIEQKNDIYSIYKVGDRPILFSNSVQIKILDLLQSGPLTLGEIISKTDMILATVRANMIKLINIGAVHSMDDTSKKNVKYESLSYKLISTNTPLLENKNLSVLFEQTVDNPKLCFKAAFFYGIDILTSSGNGSHQIELDIGNEIGKKLFEMKKDVDAQVVLEKISSINAIDVKFVLQSFIPIQIDLIDIVPGEFDYDISIPIHAGILKTYLKMKTGLNYPITYYYMGKKYHYE